MIYITNAIEALSRQLRKAVKTKSRIPRGDTSFKTPDDCVPYRKRSS